MTLNVTFKRPSLEMAMEVGSLKELAGYIQEEGSQLSKIFGDDLEMVVKGLADDTALASGTVAGEAGTETTKRRGRPPAKDKSQPDPATASAPAPLPVPPAPELAAQNAAAAATGDIPEYLRRPDAAAPPPPPPPPAPPAAPPSGILAGKVIGALDARAINDDAKSQLAKWLADYKLVNPNSSYDESIAAVRLMPDDKLAQVALALQVAA